MLLRTHLPPRKARPAQRARRRALHALGLALLLGVIALRAAQVAAEPPRFTAEVDRSEIMVGDPFIYEVTLSLGDDRAENFRPPDFKGFKVLAAPRGPNRSTQMQIGAGGTFIQTSYSWRFQLAAEKAGGLQIGPAHVLVNGHDMRSNVLSLVAVGAGAAPPTGSATAPGVAASREGLAVGAGNKDAFVRFVADKTKVYVGEAIAAAWYLYLSTPQDKMESVSEPRTDGFWSEDVVVPKRAGGLPATQDIVDGKTFQVITLMKKALFPLRAGALTVTPLEIEVARVDFFGTAVRAQRLKSTATTFEVLPLPTEGRPAGFDANNVGAFKLSATIDRDKVSAGEAVTLKLVAEGRGNLRNLRLPKVEAPPGFKSYEPHDDVALAPEDGTSGRKTREILLLPERAGTFSLGPFALAFFDPATKSYRTEAAAAVSITVSGTGAPAIATGAGTAPAADGEKGPVENVIGVEIRPIRAHATLRADTGTTLLRSPVFFWLLLLPPLGLAATSIIGRVRDRLAADTEGARRKRLRRVVEEHLGAAEKHRDAQDAAKFFVEIARVLREVLSNQLGPQVGGLTRDELEAGLRARGLDEDLRRSILDVLDTCDRARFAPDEAARSSAAMTALLERAGEIIGRLEKKR